MRRNSRPSNTSDLSWFSMYGLGVKLGISPRDVKQIAISSTGRYELVSDVVTGKKFIGPLQPISAGIRRGCYLPWDEEFGKSYDFQSC